MRGLPKHYGKGRVRGNNTGPSSCKKDLFFKTIRKAEPKKLEQKQPFSFSDLHSSRHELRWKTLLRLTKFIRPWRGRSMLQNCDFIYILVLGFFKDNKNLIGHQIRPACMSQKIVASDIIVHFVSFHHIFTAIKCISTVFQDEIFVKRMTNWLRKYIYFKALKTFRRNTCWFAFQCDYPIKLTGTLQSQVNPPCISMHFADIRNQKSS